MIKDNEGNLLIAGEYTGTFDMDPGPGVSMAANSTGQGLFLTKLDTNKNFIWSLAWAENEAAYMRDIEIDAANNIYLGGSFLDNGFDIDPISTQFVSGVDSLFGRGTGNSLLLKISASGTLLWGKSLKGGLGMKILSVNNKLSLAAQFLGGVDTTFNHLNPQFFPGSGAGKGGLVFFKLDTANGAVLSQSLTSGTANVWLADALMNDGFYYLTGSFTYGNLDFDPSPTATQSETRNGFAHQSYLLKLDTAFNYSNHIVLEGNSINSPIAIQSQNNRVWISGYYSDYDNIDLDPGPAVLAPLNRDRLYGGNYHLAFNANLRMVRHFYFPSGLTSYRQKKMLFKGGDLYLLANFYEKAFLQPQRTNGLKIDLSFLTNDHSKWSFYLLKIANNDSIQWVYYPDSEISSDTTFSAQDDMIFEDDKLLILGKLFNTIDFDLSPTDSAKLTGNNWSNFLLSINDCVNPTTLPTVNRTYSVCDTLHLANISLSVNGWHTLQHIVPGKAGCDSIIANDTVFVFLDKPTLENKGTYLEVNLSYPNYAVWLDCASQAVVQTGGNTFYPQTPGNYTVVYGHPSAPGCGDTLPCQSISQISLAEAQERLWRIYPNPATTSLEIEGPMEDLIGLRLLHVNGAAVKSFAPQRKIDLSQVAPGMYLLELETPQGISRKKLIKE
jgi:hypothetical protein